MRNTKSIEVTHENALVVEASKQLEQHGYDGDIDAVTEIAVELREIAERIGKDGLLRLIGLLPDEKSMQAGLDQLLMSVLIWHYDNVRHEMKIIADAVC